MYNIYRFRYTIQNWGKHGFIQFIRDRCVKIRFYDTRKILLFLQTRQRLFLPDAG